MPRRRCTEEPRLGVWKAAAGAPTADLGRQHGIRDATCSTGTAQSGGLTVSEARRLPVLEEETRRRKPRVAEQGLETPALSGPRRNKRVTPQAKREAVKRRTARGGLSRRRACGVGGRGRSTGPSPPHRADDSALRGRGRE